MLTDLADSDQPEYVKQERATQDPQMRVGFAHSLDQSRQGKHDRDASNENEQWKNEIVKAKTFPGRVRELIAEKAAGGAGDGSLSLRHFGEPPHRAVQPNDAKHAEAAQRIDRYDAARLQGGG